jgi:hypothetical protein
MMKHAQALIVLLFLCGVPLGLAVQAQAPTTPPVPVFPQLTAEEKQAPFVGSFFLSPIEIATLQQALMGKVATPETLAVDKKPVAATNRVIRISGVLYRSAGDWIVWMNGEKVTPQKLLPEILDIQVENSSYVRLQWFDAGLNSVISITLRPHQTYDIVTGILLPG